MLTPRRLLRRLRALFSRTRLDRELDDEIRFHLEMDAAALERHGQSPAAARDTAARHLGNVLAVKDLVRDTRRIRPVEDFLTDLRVAVRSLLRRPAFTAATLATFTLGVGGVAAVFGAVNGILLTPLPYTEPDRIVAALEFNRKQNAEQEVSPGNFLDWRDRARAFEQLASAEPFGLDWVSSDGPVYLPTWLVSEGFFDVARTRPLHGRTFRRDEHQTGRGKVVVLGWSVWQRYFGGNPSVIGTTLTLDAEPWEVVGVMPRDFELPDGNHIVWAPKVLAGWEATARTSPFYTVIGRIRDGVTLDGARADLDRVSAQLAQEHPATNVDIGAHLIPLPERVVGGARAALAILLGAVGLVMLVAAANVTSLQLARALDRGREFAVRTALGARGGRMIRQLVTESLLLAVVGSGLGFGLAVAGLAAIRQLAPPELPRPDQLRADGMVLLVALAVGVLTAVLSGVVPAVSASRADPAQGLTHGSRAFTAGRGARRLRGALVTSQFAVAVVLVVGAGLLLRSFVAVMSADRGFRSERALVLVTQAWSYFPKPDQRVEFVRQALERIEALPGVEMAGMTSSIPLGDHIGAEQGRVTIPGRPVDPNQIPEVHVTIATAGFFRALAIPLVQGRLFVPEDRSGSAPVILVNEAFVRRFFPDGSALGQRVQVGLARTTVAEREIVGVVADVRRYALHQSAQPGVYLPHAHAPTGAVGFIVRTTVDPDLLMDRVKRELWSLNPAMPVSIATTMERLVGESVRERRFLLALLGVFGLVALGLAATGIFGVMSYITGERTREIGVRMAFGADRSRVLAMVLRDGGRLAGAGIVAGLAGALLTTRVLRGMLYGVGTLDPVTFAAGAILLLGVAMAATWVPARRAAGLDPVDALRAE